MERRKTMVKFLTFEQFHNKKGIGSTNIRVHQLLKYWPEASIYRYGENADCMIFQKVYCGLDYKFPAHFEGKKILDICDPDWMQGRVFVKETVDAVDAVTCPTEVMQRFIQQMTNKPVVVIKDRFDIELVPEPKPHDKEAKTVVWFGYRHNAELLKPAMHVIDELGLNLIIIADDDPILYQYSTRDRHDFYEFVKYNEDTFYENMQKADYALLPQGFRPQDVFKSENKTIKAKLAGLPVARTADDMRKFADPKERQLAIDTDYANIKQEYDVRKSVKEMKELIASL